MKAVAVIFLVSLFGCSASTSKNVGECAESAALKAETGREYSKLLFSRDPALGAVHVDDAKRAFVLAVAWHKQACSNQEKAIRLLVEP